VARQKWGGRDFGSTRLENARGLGGVHGWRANISAIRGERASRKKGGGANPPTNKGYNDEFTHDKATINKVAQAKRGNSCTFEKRNVGKLYQGKGKKPSILEWSKSGGISIKKTTGDILHKKGKKDNWITSTSFMGGERGKKFFWGEKGGNLTNIIV